MNIRKNDPDAILDRALSEIQNEEIDPALVRTAGERVWSRLAREADRPADDAAVETIRSCADVQNLIPAYLKGSLSEPRCLLVEDHTRECVPCRRVLREMRSGGGTPVRSALTTRPRDVGWRPAVAWAMAATVLLVIAVGASFTWLSLTVDPALSAVRVESVQGALYRVSGTRSASAAPGEEIPGGEIFRTAKGSRASVLLADGSRVEMNERSEMTVSARRSETSLQLKRGSIIVEAAKQRDRHLYVGTSDCRVAVTGTVFSVNHGTKGSRVSVIEGEVHVRHSGQDAVLRPGDQVSTSPTLENVPVAAEIAWSGNAQRHLSVLHELTKLAHEIEALPHPGPRHASRLLDLVPNRTVVYAAVPNLGGTLDEAHRLLLTRVAENPILREWWAETVTAQGTDAQLAAAVEKIRTLGSYLKDEIVLAVVAGASGRPEGFVLLSELEDPTGFRAFLDSEIANLNAGEAGPRVRILDDARDAPASDDDREQLLVWIGGDVFAASNSATELQSISKGRASGRIAPTRFREQVAQAYRDGTSFLLAADVQSLVRAGASDSEPHRAETLQRTGLLDAESLVVEGEEKDGKTTYRAVLSFDQPRRGIASWLAAPAPMGSLEFVSPEASLAVAFVAKSASSLLQDLFEILAAEHPDFRTRLAQFESEHGVSVLHDLAEPIGGEFAFALDGPVLPTPAWKLVAEVYDPARLQRAIEWAVAEANRTQTQSGSPGLVIEAREQGGRVWYSVRAGRLPGEVHYTFVDGYLVAAPARNLVEEAISRREAGTHLPASVRFAELLPQDGNANFSAVAYQNLGPILSPLARSVAPREDAVADAAGNALQALAKDAPASLAYAYGETDRIIFASTRPGGMFGAEIEALLGLSGMMRLQHEVGRIAVEELPAGTTPVGR